MLLIISTQKDRSTSDVINWISFFNVPYIRLNEEDHIISLKIVNDSIEFETISGKRIDIRNLTGYWYRRGGLKLFVRGIINTKKDYLDEEIEDFKKKEASKLLDYIYYSLDRVKNSLTSQFLIHPNKLKVLHIAKSVGLIIPNTIILTDRKDIKHNYNLYSPCTLLDIYRRRGVKDIP